MIRYGCKQLPEAPEMTLESPVSVLDCSDLTHSDVPQECSLKPTRLN